MTNTTTTKSLYIKQAIIYVLALLLVPAVLSHLPFISTGLTGWVIGIYLSLFKGTILFLIGELGYQAYKQSQSTAPTGYTLFVKDAPFGKLKNALKLTWVGLLVSAVRQTLAEKKAGK